MAMLEDWPKVPAWEDRLSNDVCTCSECAWWVSALHWIAPDTYIGCTYVKQARESIILCTQTFPSCELSSWCCLSHVLWSRLETSLNMDSCSCYIECECVIMHTYVRNRAHSSSPSWEYSDSVWQWWEHPDDPSWQRAEKECSVILLKSGRAAQHCSKNSKLPLTQFNIIIIG